MTKRSGSLERAVIRSSVMPSLKYSWSRSPLMLVKGKTAIEGVSGMGRAGGCAGGMEADGEDAAPHIFSRESLCLPGRRRRVAGFREHPEYSYRFRDVLDRLLAEVLVAQCELIADLFMHFAGDADAARFGEALEAGGNVDTIAVDLPTLLHHVAQVDADPKLHPPLRLPCRVFRLERALDHHGALDRIHDAGKLRHYAIACRINESSTVLFDQRI